MDLTSLTVRHSLLWKQFTMGELSDYLCSFATYTDVCPTSKSSLVNNFYVFGHSNQLPSASLPLAGCQTLAQLTMPPNGQKRSLVLKDFQVALKTSSSIAKNLLQSKGKNAYQAAILPGLPASKQRATETEGEFKQFTKLPKEIQIIIWKIIIADSRLITQFVERASRHWLTGKCVFRKHSWRKFFFTVPNYPPVLHVCSLSRDLARSAWGNGRLSGTLFPRRPGYDGSAEIVEICLIDCVSHVPQSPSYSFYQGESQEFILLCEGLYFVRQIGAKTIAMDLDKWATVESEDDWPDQLASFFQFQELYTLEKIILFYSDVACPEKLALMKTMISDFSTGSNSPLSVIRDDLIRALIKNDERFVDFTFEDWKLPTFELVGRKEWKQWSGVWADTHDTCLHHVPAVRDLRYKIRSFRCSLEHADDGLRRLFRLPRR